MARRRRSGPGAKEGLAVLAAVAVAGALVWGAANLDDDGSSGLLDDGPAPAGTAAGSESEGVTASGWAAPTLAAPADGLVGLDAPTAQALGTAVAASLVEQAPVVVTSASATGPEADAAADLARSLRVPLLVTQADGAPEGDATEADTADATAEASDAPASESEAPPAETPDAATLLADWSTAHVVAVGPAPETGATIHEVVVEQASPADDASEPPAPTVSWSEEVEAMLADAEAAAAPQDSGVLAVVRTEGDAPGDEPSGDATEDEDQDPTEDVSDDASGEASEESDATSTETSSESASPAPSAPSVDPAELPVDLAVTLEVLGVEGVGWSGDDPRTDDGLRATLADAPTTLLAVADDQWPGDLPRTTVTPDWPALFTAAAGAPELVGGGLTLFPERTFIATYGNPSGPALGVLGERDVQGSIDYVEDLAADYEGLFGDSRVQPAFELITTIASAEAGDDGDYSRPEDLELVAEWVDAANEAGIYVVLDLQPGRTDFLTQAQTLEDLLRRPNVGLALDPEWRLADDEVHLEQIGTVTTEEVNEVSDWLAGLVRDEVLPQKLLIVHNFRLSMLSDREDLAFHPELATMVHVDGQGAQDDKDATYEAITQVGPDELWWGWKNFFDEDAPGIRSPEDTAQVEPTPHFISYQ